MTFEEWWTENSKQIEEWYANATLHRMIFNSAFKLGQEKTAGCQTCGLLKQVAVLSGEITDLKRGIQLLQESNTDYSIRLAQAYKTERQRCKDAITNHMVGVPCHANQNCHDFKDCNECFASALDVEPTT